MNLRLSDRLPRVTTKGNRPSPGDQLEDFVLEHLERNVGTAATSARIGPRSVAEAVRPIHRYYAIRPAQIMQLKKMPGR